MLQNKTAAVSGGELHFYKQRLFSLHLLETQKDRQNLNRIHKNINITL